MKGTKLLLKVLQAIIIIIRRAIECGMQATWRGYSDQRQRSVTISCVVSGSYKIIGCVPFILNPVINLGVRHPRKRKKRTAQWLFQPAGHCPITVVMVWIPDTRKHQD